MQWVTELTLAALLVFRNVYLYQLPEPSFTTLDEYKKASEDFNVQK